MSVTPLRPAEQALARITTVLMDAGVGTIRKVVRVTGCPPEPNADGSRMFQPRTVLLLWTTADGITWSFSQAVLTGVYLDRSGQPGRHLYIRTVHAGRPGPVWLPALANRYAPGQENPR